jgi:hypothetical protein
LCIVFWKRLVRMVASDKIDKNECEKIGWGGKRAEKGRGAEENIKLKWPGIK